MNGETRLIDTVVLVHAYTVSDDEKHSKIRSHAEPDENDHSKLMK